MNKKSRVLGELAGKSGRSDCDQTRKVVERLAIATMGRGKELLLFQLATGLAWAFAKLQVTEAARAKRIRGE